MPTDREPDPAAVRAIRLAVGVTIALVVADAFKVPNSFIAPLLAAMLLSLPLPAPGLLGALKFGVAIALSLGVGLLLIPVLEYAAAAGLVLLSLLLFGCFVYGARGGNPVISALLTMGLTVIPVIGSESPAGAYGLTKNFLMAFAIAMPVVWLAHGIMPDPPTPVGTQAPEPPPAPDPAAAGAAGLRALFVVMPMVLWFYIVSGTAGFAGVMMKVSALGQQASTDGSRALSRSVLLSTFIGGVAAIVLWTILRIWPVLLIYALLVLLAGLYFGRRVFLGRALAPTAQTWSYAFTTLLVILGPAVLDNPGSDGAHTRFFDRIVMFGIATSYGSLALFLFDRLRRRPGRASRTAAVT